METRTKSEFRRDAARRALVMERVLDAPRELVWKACTDPALIPRWWGPRRLTTHVEKMDVRPGGEWRYVQYAEDGSEFGFHGVYREIVPPERLVNTFNYEGTPGHEAVVTITLKEQDGRTRLTNTTAFDDLQSLDGYIGSGAEGGMTESMDRLEEILQELKEKASARR